MGNKIVSFTDLIVWQESHSMVLNIYTITLAFPKDEHYGLRSQIRRASVSISSNIAEGFYRRTASDKIRFYYDSLASAAEVQNQLIIARDLQYITSTVYQSTLTKLIHIKKLLNGLINSAMTKT